jgi:GrpB-like predicted nucleotidyltransferase (UPF0157 family)
MQIYLAPYSIDWPKKFEREKKLLLKAIGEWVEDIQHVGSTAVPGLSAKPIIDIMIGIESLTDADEHCIVPLEQLGYEYVQQFESETPERRYFRKSSQGVRTYQIHLVEIDSDWWQRHLLFRDYLRSHPQAANEYETLKQALAKVHSDTNEYATAKTAFIRKIEKKARRGRKDII